MKYKCNLCGETFNENEFETTNIDGEITIDCPNGCVIGTICLDDFSDVTKVD